MLVSLLFLNAHWLSCTSLEPGQSSFRVLLTTGHESRHKKTSLCISREAVRIALEETQREASADAPSLQGVVFLEVFERFT